MLEFHAEELGCTEFEAAIGNVYTHMCDQLSEELTRLHQVAKRKGYAVDRLTIEHATIGIVETVIAQYMSTEGEHVQPLSDAKKRLKNELQKSGCGESLSSQIVRETVKQAEVSFAEIYPFICEPPQYYNYHFLQTAAFW